jgi:hypothetical protein
MLSREVEEAQQRLGIVADLGGRLGPLDAVVTGERLDRVLGVLAVGRIPDLRQRPARPSVHRLGQGREHVGGLVDPVALLAGGGEHLPQGGPQPQPAIADRHHRRAHAATAQIPQQLGPRLGRLALSVGHRDQLLGAVGADPTITKQHRWAWPSRTRKWSPSAQTYT